MHRNQFDLGDFKRPSRAEKALDYLTAIAIGTSLAVLLVTELSK
jgi:hypothetical protein